VTAAPVPGQGQLRVDNLSVAYGRVVALRDVSICVEPGDFFAVLGANGAGKSTLLKAISGLVTPSAGSVSFNGETLTKLRPDLIAGRGLAHVPERRRVFPNMTVAENLRMGAYSVRASDLTASMNTMFEMFPRLRERSRQKAGSLSGGEQQMLAIGRALMSQPRLLMLDEPSLGLAPVIVEQVFDRILQIHRDLGVSVVLVEQNATTALEVAERGIVLENGRVTFAGTADELTKSPYLRQAYLGI
jgi:branched-chain amino acid transport system ATP-binding protein